MTEETVLIPEKDERLSDVDLEELSYPDLQHWAKIVGVKTSLQTEHMRYTLIQLREGVRVNDEVWDHPD